MIEILAGAAHRGQVGVGFGGPSSLLLVCGPEAECGCVES